MNRIFWVIIIFFMFAACTQKTTPVAEQTIDKSFIVAEQAGEENVEIAFDGDSKEFNNVSFVAELKLKSGSIVRFVDEGYPLKGEGRIGIIEITEPEVEPVLWSLVKENQPTPLEVFLTLAPPETEPPELLLRDHKRVAKAQGQVGQKPRNLQIPEAPKATKAYIPIYLGGGNAVQSGFESSSCLSNFNLPITLHLEFLQDVVGAFGENLGNHGHGHDLISTHYGVTGFSSQRALGTCNASGYVKSVRISYEWIPNFWVNVPLYNGLTENFLVPGQRIFYYSDSWPLIYRYRIRVGYTTSGIEGNRAHTEGSW